MIIALSDILPYPVMVKNTKNVNNTHTPEQKQHKKSKIFKNNTLFKVQSFGATSFYKLLQVVGVLATTLDLTLL